jgi:hypothetical protein
VPVVKDGITRSGNLLPACVSCNSRKRHRDLEVFAVEAGISEDRMLEIYEALSIGDVWV